MPFPRIVHSRAAVHETDADAVLLVTGAFPVEGDAPALADRPGLSEGLRAIGFTGSAGSYRRVPDPAVLGRALAVVGVGDAPDAAAVRDAVGTGIRSLTGFATIAVGLAGVDASLWRAAAEGAALGGYRFEGYKKDGPKRRADTVVVHADIAVEDAEVAAVIAVADAVALVKELVSVPGGRLGPDDLARRAEASVAQLPVAVEVFDEDRLARDGYGGILGVGLGSDRPPRLVRLDYAPDGATGHVAVVGKGITFDSGGLSLKPAAAMMGMKYDMCGAATALAVVRAAAALGLPTRVTAWLCLAENMPSGRATRPGDVLELADGTTVEVTNTDAEGRLVLADGIVAASRENPDLVVDVATLTGAVTAALGTRHMGVMGDDEAVGWFLESARHVDEPAWRLPLPEHMVEELDSPIADLQNAKVGDTAGGTVFAGLFLRHFVGRTGPGDDAPRLPWVHLDIAGVGMNKGSAYGFTDKGPTGASVRALIALVAAHADRR